MNSPARYICLLCLLVVSSLCYGQNNDNGKPNKTKDKTSIIKLNKLDVVYPDEEYTGITIEQKATGDDDKSVLYEKQYLLDPPPVEDTDMLYPNLYQTAEDEGAESEDEILYASFDPNVIHYPKIDLSKWNAHDTVTLHLVNPKKGEVFVFPTPSTSVPTSHFGARRRRFHYGLDLGMPTGQPIFAAFDGVVRVSVDNKSYGKLIVIRHHNGLETYYAHMSKRIAQVGDTVHAGDTIGLCGNTGRSYGSHLHFETRYMGAALNPEHVVDVATRKLKNDVLKLTPRSFNKTGVASGNGGGTTTSNGVTYYRVRQGDTLSKIAQRNHTTVRRLCQLNGIKETTILSVGRRLRIR